MSTTTTISYPVTGMTCGHCVGAVTEELTALPGVTALSVDLVAGGTSTVTITSDTAIGDDQVAAALAEAGDYRLATA
ncbi:heavy-metal-associated domain-containing protein [Mycolicibacterium tusciae]|uniref:heavy-metal-associated domain-containing protein n=1 Tax=Mycolicibacterium tusciae TaxID=75922 RepID=UPI00024A3EF3|nr:heavy-metal-associated domain-containing protein [Mycolicibacterium tusciae]